MINLLQEKQNKFDQNLLWEESMLYTKAPCGKVDVNKKCYKADIYMK